MSKSSKAASKIRNKAAKMSRKAANRSKYSSVIGTDDNIKSKSNHKVRSKTRAKGLHLMDNCGNIGCSHCNPEIREA